MREKGLREEDPFDEIVSRSLVFDLQDETSFEEVVAQIAEKLQSRVHLSAEQIRTQIMEGSIMGATPVTHGVALPHFRTDRIDQAELALVRAREGVQMTMYDPLTHVEEGEVRVQAIFFLVSPENNPTRHLRILARIAERVDEESFFVAWEDARDDHDLRECLLHDNRFLTLHVYAHLPTGGMVNEPLRAVGIPKGCLVATLSRHGQSIVPNGSTVLEEGDRLTIIGEEMGLAELRGLYLKEE
jgi:mannitol/fructose-specific phosphotransferase system IIA component (Ntr-type)